MTERIDTIIVGGGPAGLAVSYELTQQGRLHLVLEKRRIGEAWRSGKWDSFTLVSPNWSLKLPGFAYSGSDPDGYLGREDVVCYIEDYARSFDPPVRTGIEVTCVSGTDGGFAIETSAGAFEAANVVVATGAFQKPKIPSYAASIASHVVQLHSGRYKNPAQLPPGAVLVVGSGQSGCQIAEELYKSGRQVYLSTGKAIRLPRRYRGRDVFRWGEALGMFHRTAETLESPAERFEANPQLSGKDGGHALNLHQFALDGVTLLGRLLDANGTTLSIAGDLKENLGMADHVEAKFKDAVDGYIARNEINAPEETSIALHAGYDSELVTELDLESADINTIIWATGYAADFTWVQFPIFDAYGYPEHQRGVTAQPGLYFIGLLWQHKPISSLFLGMGDDAAYIAAHIAERAQA